MERWRGRTALVTGASGGIGYATVETLAKSGINVIGCARNTGTLEALKDKLPKGSGSICALKCDLSKEEEILQMFKTIEEKHKHVDILVNNAGRYDTADMATGDTKHWRAMIDLNILALSICAREALRLMEKNGIDDGHIININSNVGHTMPDDSSIHFYASTKHMVTAVTAALYMEMKQKRSKIRVTSISPGTTSTPGIDVLAADIPALGSFKLLEAHDIANAIAYVIAAPAHVNVKELEIVPVDQFL